MPMVAFAFLIFLVKWASNESFESTMTPTFFSASDFSSITYCGPIVYLKLSIVHVSILICSLLAD